MRVGKKPKVADPKRTRACVVRLEKVRAPPAKQNFIKRASSQIVSSVSNTSGKSSISVSSLHDKSDDRKFKGPLKKRPIAPTLSTPSPKQKEKLSPTGKSIKQATATKSEPVSLEETPTVASGRSRRAIKPNPKYSSEDVVTSKLIKNVAQLGGMANRRELAPDKKRKHSISSSSDDFYNKDSSDADYTGFDDIRDDDSDFSDLNKAPTPIRGARGRPRSTVHLQQAPGQRTITPNIKNSSSSLTTFSTKNLPSRYLQMRKNISATNIKRDSLKNSIQEHSGVKKRKFFDSDSDGDIITKRKKFYSSTINSKDTSPTSLPNTYSLHQKNFLARKHLISNTTLNGSKILHSPASKSESTLLVKKNNNLLERGVTSKLVPKTLSTKIPQNPIDHPKMITKLTMKQKPSSSPVSIPPKTTKIEKELYKSGKAQNNSPSATVDDFETMPTFTIVNINDIINKKGDVLISKTNSMAKSTPNKFATKDFECDTSENEDEESLELENKLLRRKSGHLKSSSTEKMTTVRERKDSPLHTSTLTLPIKKPAQTILNHTLSNKNMNKVNSRSPRVSNASKFSNSVVKPAPRILNSMVAKKTLPVKPLIANLDDSAEETQLNADNDSDDEVDDDMSFFTNKRRTYPVKKLSTQTGTTKENSLAGINHEAKPAVNTSKAIATPRKISPEKVVISRQGDKIIKKITCFETWYIINLPEDRPAEVVRNQLDLPLIKLANASNKISLPTKYWSSKVTLYQLSSGALSKSNYTVYTGDLHDHNISEEDRTKFQPSCVMFRRTAIDRSKCRLPYDRAVIFKNKTFFTNIEGKNVKLVGAPYRISSLAEVEILLQLVDELTLHSNFVEQTATIQ